jgi:hypothetical protein
VPPGSRTESRTATVLTEVGWLVLPGVLLALGASSMGALLPLVTGTLAVVLGWYALRLGRWERRNGKRIYGERRFWAWDAPFFLLWAADPRP